MTSKKTQNLQDNHCLVIIGQRTHREFYNSQPLFKVSRCCIAVRVQPPHLFSYGLQQLQFLGPIELATHFVEPRCVRDVVHVFAEVPKRYAPTVLLAPQRSVHQFWTWIRHRHIDVCQHTRQRSHQLCFVCFSFLNGTQRNIL